MTADVELLPLPGVLPFSAAGARKALQDWCRANVAHATAAKDAEIEALRAIIDNREAIIATHAADTREYQKQIMHAEARAERLAEALRPLAGLDLRPDGFDKRDDSQPVYARDKSEITVGDVRRAVAALRDHDQEVGNG